VSKEKRENTEIKTEVFQEAQKKLSKWSLLTKNVKVLWFWNLNPFLKTFFTSLANSIICCLYYMSSQQLTLFGNNNESFE
jgi:hypothetical protein